MLVWRNFKHGGGWLTNKEILAKTPGVKRRTVTKHTSDLVRLKILEQVELFPGHQFRISGLAETHNPDYLQRLKEADFIFASKGF